MAPRCGALEKEQLVGNPSPGPMLSFAWLSLFKKCNSDLDFQGGLSPH